MKVPHVVRLKTIITKVVGVICAVGGGLVVGKVSEKNGADAAKSFHKVFHTDCPE